MIILHRYFTCYNVCFIETKSLVFVSFSKKKDCDVFKHKHCFVWKMFCVFRRRNIAKQGRTEKSESCEHFEESRKQALWYVITICRIKTILQKKFILNIVSESSLKFISKKRFTWLLIIIKKKNKINQDWTTLKTRGWSKVKWTLWSTRRPGPIICANHTSDG